MSVVSQLRSLGPVGLSEFLRARPELVGSRPPRTLAELADRLRRPAALHAALRRWDLPTLQANMALAALGERADGERLAALLGVRPGDDPPGEAGRAGLERALAAMDAEHLLRRPGPRLIPEAADLWARPLGLDGDAAAYAEQCTADVLRAILKAHGEPGRQRKADLVAAVVRVLDDADRIRALVAQAPPETGDLLHRVASGSERAQYYGWYSPGRFSPGRPSRNPAEWALDRFLLVRSSWSEYLAMPASVALALRGPGWAAPFDHQPPSVAWTAVDPAAVPAAADAAATAAQRALSAVLTDAGTRPLTRLKSGAVGVREVRRVAAAAELTPGRARLVLALARELGLLALTGDSFAPTESFDRWQARPAPERHGHLLRAWLALPAISVDDELPWDPQDIDDDHRLTRCAVLGVLAERTDAAASPADVLRAARWRAPLAVGPDPQAGLPVVLAVLAEAEWLGVTGHGVLSPAGAAAVAAPADADVVPAVTAALAGRLAEARTVARFQADLTAVVLGEPAPDLADVLALAADRETRSTASVWRFSPASVRRALDAGTTASDLLERLTALADGGLPQPLAYLVQDVARRHGALRGGLVACYLRSDDEPLLAEIAVDRRLRKLGLRRIAPTVVVGTRPLAETLTTLRTAGYSPVEEGPDGDVVLARPPRVRARAGAGRSGHAGGVAAFTRPRPDTPAQADPAAVAAALLDTADDDAQSRPHPILATGTPRQG